jgi:hypothetical protein
MSDDDADRFRKQAEDCREQAAKAVSPLDKEAWLRVAEEWLKLALSVEDRRRKYGRLSWRPHWSAGYPSQVTLLRMALVPYSGLPGMTTPRRSQRRTKRETPPGGLHGGVFC